MSSIDILKNQLIDRILVTKNEDLLNAINGIFNSTASDSKLELNSFQIEMIEMGLKDIESGNVISESDLEKQDSEWMD